VSTKPVADDDREEIQLPDNDSDSESDGPPAQPTLDHSNGLLSQSNTLCMDTVDTNSELPNTDTDMAFFFTEFVNDEGETMRRCNACL
jgi:hypothetical protein